MGFFVFVVHCSPPVEGLKAAWTSGVHFVETSAKEGWNVTQVFRDLVRQMQLGVSFDRNESARCRRYTCYLQKEIVRQRELLEGLPSAEQASTPAAAEEAREELTTSIRELITWVSDMLVFLSCRSCTKDV